MLYNWEREAIYRRQNGCDKITPRQLRRLNKKRNYWSKRDPA